MKTLFIGLIICLTGSLALADSIAVNVLDSSKNPIAGATVKLTSSKLTSTQTNPAPTFLVEPQTAPTDTYGRTAFKVTISPLNAKLTLTFNVSKTGWNSKIVTYNYAYKPQQPQVPVYVYLTKSSATTVNRTFKPLAAPK